MPETPERSVEQQAAEADVEGFRKALGPFVVAAETTRMAMLFTDAKAPGHPIIFANESLLDLTGYGREELLGDSFNSLMARGLAPEAMALIEAAFDGSSDIDPEICYQRRDGSEFWASVFVSPVRDAGGAIVQHFASIIDLTKHKEEQVESKMLIEELNHRVKNTLSAVQSIRLSGAANGDRSGGDPGIHRVPPLGALALARPAKPGELEKRGAARCDPRCLGAVRGDRRSGGALCDRG